MPINPRDMAKEDLAELVERLCEAVWPEGDPGHEWSPDTISDVATILTDAGLRPDDPEDAGV